jgi:predicted metal-dependent phosphotriesterase family hydrolase
VDESATGSTTAVGAAGQSALGAALVDEHVFAARQGFEYCADREALYSEAREVGAAALRELAGSGISTILDTTTIECGRDGELLGTLAESTGVRVLASTGLSSEADGVSRSFRSLSATQLANIYIAELSEAIPGTALRAAAVVVETSGPAASFDETALLAASFAHAETGAPVLVRAPASGMVGVVDRLKARGVEPDRLLILGLDAPSTSFEVVGALARRGVLLGITSVGDDSALDSIARAALAAYVLRAYGPRQVCVGTGAVISGPEAGAHGAEGFRRFREHVGAFGAGELLDEALRCGPERLFGGLDE